MNVSQKLSTSELLYLRAQQMGLQPVWVTHKGLFAISVRGQERYINFARSPLNSHTGASLAKNKYLTRLILARHHKQNIPFLLPHSYEEAALFLQTHGKIIAKPVLGAGAHDIHIVTNLIQLRELSNSRYILEKYIAGIELRYLVLNGSVISVHRSDYGTSVSETRPLERISYDKADWDPELIGSSIHIASLLGLKFAAVDFLIDAQGQAYVLEVNSTPGLKWFHAPTSGPIIDVARKFLEAITEDEEPSNTSGDIPSLESHPIKAYS
jgi:glutathione synthase/RimK-type ligase-like ATP-grasp enzyme